MSIKDTTHWLLIFKTFDGNGNKKRKRVRVNDTNLSGVIIDITNKCNSDTSLIPMRAKHMEGKTTQRTYKIHTETDNSNKIVNITLKENNADATSFSRNARMNSNTDNKSVDTDTETPTNNQDESDGYFVNHFEDEFIGQPR